MMSEMSHIQEIIDALCLLAGDPHTLPPSSEQVINDLKGNDIQHTYSYQVWFSLEINFSSLSEVTQIL